MGILDNIINKFQGVIKREYVYGSALDKFMRPKSNEAFQYKKSFFVCPYHRNDLKMISMESDLLSTIHLALRTEIFRNGINCEKAENTDETITSEEEEYVVDESEEKLEKTRILESFNNINMNHQSVIDVLKECEDDLNIWDDMFIMFRFDYILGSDNRIDFDNSDFVEAFRITPRAMDFVMNERDEPAMDDRGNDVLVCPNHRSSIITRPQGADPDDYRCKVCGCMPEKAYYVSRSGSNDQYYFRNEVLHASFYRPGKRFGFSPVITTWMKVSTLMWQDDYMLQTYQNKREPKSMLIFNTVNGASLQKNWNEMVDRAKQNPNLPGIMSVNMPNGKKIAEHFNFMRSLEEMQFMPQRDEFRRVVGGLFGVSPIFSNDVSSSGGLNNEGLQITVTNRRVEAKQALYNEKIIPKFLEVLGYDGWSVTLNPSEEADEMARLQRQNQTLINGQLAAQIGLEAQYDSDSGEIIIKDGTVSADAPTGDSLDFFDDPFSESTPEPTSGEPEEPEFDVFNMSNDEILNASLPMKAAPISLHKAISNIIQKVLNKFKSKPTELELRKALEDVRTKLQFELRNMADSKFRVEYIKGMQIAEKELNMNFSFDDVDQNALTILKTQKVLQKAFVGLSDKIANKIQGIISDAYENPKGLTTQALTKRIQNISNVARSRAENIARTETSKVSMAARRVSYQKADPDDTFKFKHIGPNDARTTNVSKRIKRRTQKGVSWGEYVEIVMEESKKDFPEWTVNPLSPVSHYQSRHTFVRTV